MRKVLILGGYGNFGQKISTRLAKSGISIIIAGRSKEKAEKLAKQLTAEATGFNVNKELNEQLKILKPYVVINTCGPFQNADYAVAKTCIENKVHYIDLADGRDFVCGITALDAMAKQNDVLVVSGASTVPGLSSAVLKNFKGEFSIIDSLVYGITPGQKTPRGLATTQGVLSYLGKPLKKSGDSKIRYGWQDIYRQGYPELGNRWMANCDIPDLDLFPQKYNIKSIRFSAGMENTFFHFSIWILSWLKRLCLPIKLENYAALFLKLSHLFDKFGTSNGGMHIIITGKDKRDKPLQKNWFIIAKNNDGPQIPCVPAIILSKKLIAGELKALGAMPCIDLLTLDEYLNELRDFNIKEIITHESSK